MRAMVSAPGTPPSSRTSQSSFSGPCRAREPPTGASAIDVRSANAGFITGGRISSIETGLRFEGTGTRVGPLDNAVLAHKIETVTIGIELFANGHIVKGMVVRNAPIFNAEKVIHVHAASGATSDRATLNYFDGITVLGSTNSSRNTHEILEEGNHSTDGGGAVEGNVYNLKFLPGESSLTTLYEPTLLWASNRPDLPPRGSSATRWTRSRSGSRRHRRTSITRNCKGTVEWSCGRVRIRRLPSHSRSR